MQHVPASNNTHRQVLARTGTSLLHRPTSYFWMSGHKHLGNVQMFVSNIWTMSRCLCPDIYKPSYLQSVTQLCFINTRALFYLTIRITHYSDCLMKQQAALHLLHSNLLRLRVCKFQVHRWGANQNFWTGAI